MIFFSWMFSAVLFVGGLLMIYFYKRLAVEIIDAIVSGWSRVVDLSHLKESKFAIYLFRFGFIFAGIVALLMAIVNLTGPIQL